MSGHTHTGRGYTVHLGDCREVMAGMEAGSVDSIVTDPPYGLSFMGKDWDHGVPGEPFWREALRVAKPGAHLLAFGGTRTFHRLAVAIEDAGWEIRDTVMWVYGSGFPKSLDVSKAIDKAAGAERTEIVGKSPYEGRRPNAWGGNKNGNNTYGDYSSQPEMPIFAPSTDAARQWQGWGTALKPAWEPVILARKPLEGTVAGNVLAHGTGGINIDGCRGPAAEINKEPHTQGRFPANLIHDGSDEVMGLFPETGASSNAEHRGTPKIEHGDSGSAARFFYSVKASKKDRDEGLAEFEAQEAGGMSGRHDGSMGTITMSRNHHPTVKPTALMAYLCRLVTPPGGTVLDLFMGSGSTGKAAIREGFHFQGIDLSAEYLEIARARIEYEANQHHQGELSL